MAPWGDAIDLAAERAVSLLETGGVDEHFGLPDAQSLAWTQPEPDLFRPSEVPVRELIERACAIEAGANGVSDAVRSSSASFSTHDSRSALATSTGFSRSYSASIHTGACGATARDDHGQQADFWSSAERAIDRIEDPQTIGQKAARLAMARRGPKSLSSRRSAILFEGDAAESLIVHLSSALSGDAQYRRASFLLGAEGRSVMPAHIDIVEDPFLPLGLASFPFDADGVPGQRRHIFQTGVVQGYFLGTYAARKLGLKSTGNANGPSNLLVSSAHTSPTDDRDAMLKTLGTGLVVSRLAGQGVNLTNGDYSRAATGFWVERGEIAYPVDGVTIAGNLSEMLSHIVAIGADIWRRTPVCTGSILIDAMTIAGN